jgi:hypothetical protein
VSLHTIGQAVKGINIGDVKRLSVILPSLDEQEQIADRLESIDAALHETTRQLHKLTSLKAGLMQDLLSGTRRVTALRVASRADDRVPDGSIPSCDRARQSCVCFSGVP